MASPIVPDMSVLNHPRPLNLVGQLNSTETSQDTNLTEENIENEHGTPSALKLKPLSTLNEVKTLQPGVEVSEQMSCSSDASQASLTGQLNSAEKSQGTSVIVRNPLNQQPSGDASTEAITSAPLLLPASTPLKPASTSVGLGVESEDSEAIQDSKDKKQDWEDLKKFVIVIKNGKYGSGKLRSYRCSICGKECNYGLYGMISHIKNKHFKNGVTTKTHLKPTSAVLVIRSRKIPCIASKSRISWKGISR